MTMLPDARGQFDTSTVDAAFSRRGQEKGEIWTRRETMLKHLQADEWQEIMSSAKAKAQAKAQLIA